MGQTHRTSMGRTVQRISIITPFNIAPQSRRGAVEVFDLTVLSNNHIFLLAPIRIELHRQFSAPQHQESFMSCYTQDQVQQLVDDWENTIEAEKGLIDRACEADNDGWLRPLYVDLICEQIINA